MRRANWFQAIGYLTVALVSDAGVSNMKKYISAIVGIIVLLAIANNFIRVSDGYKSYGYIEELLFKEPIKRKFNELFFSKNYVLYEDVNERTFYIAGIIEKFGTEIIDNIIYEKERINAIDILERAISNCSKIPDDYLFNSNPELPAKYRTHFQTALILWHTGLQNKKQDTIIEGNKEYNYFLRWIQSKSRDDFKNLK